MKINSGFPYELSMYTGYSFFNLFIKYFMKRTVPVLQQILFEFLILVVVAIKFCSSNFVVAIKVVVAIGCSN